MEFPSREGRQLFSRVFSRDSFCQRRALIKIDSPLPEFRDAHFGGCGTGFSLLFLRSKLNARSLTMPLLGGSHSFVSPVLPVANPFSRGFFPAPLGRSAPSTVAAFFSPFPHLLSSISSFPESPFQFRLPYLDDSFFLSLCSGFSLFSDPPLTCFVPPFFFDSWKKPCIIIFLLIRCFRNPPFWVSLCPF